MNSQISQMQDEDVSKALNSKGGRGQTPRGKLFERMMQQWTPVFLTDAYQLARRVEREGDTGLLLGLEWRTAEGIMRAIEDKLLTNREWLELQPAWEEVYLVAERGVPPPMLHRRSSRKQ